MEKSSHPEQKPDEIYLGNASADTILRSSWKTSRRGINPLGSNGLPLDKYFPETLKPWFIKTDEVRERIAAEKSRQSGICAIAVTALESLIESRTIFPSVAPEAGEVVHGFTLPPGQDASSLEWWPEFSAYFARVEGFAPNHRDSTHKRLFEYFVEGAYCQAQEPLFVPAGRTIADINAALEKAGAAGGPVTNEKSALENDP